MEKGVSFLYSRKETPYITRMKLLSCRLLFDFAFLSYQVSVMTKSFYN